MESSIAVFLLWHPACEQVPMKPRSRLFRRALHEWDMFNLVLCDPGLPQPQTYRGVPFWVRAVWGHQGYRYSTVHAIQDLTLYTPFPASAQNCLSALPRWMCANCAHCVALELCFRASIPFSIFVYERQLTRRTREPE